MEKVKAKVIMPGDEPEENEPIQKQVDLKLDSNEVEAGVAKEDKDAISDLAADFIEDKPDASEGVTLEGVEEKTDGGPNYEALYGKDSTGTVFDPDLHATNKEGRPSVTPSGKYRKKKGYGKKSTTPLHGLSISPEEARREEIERNSKQLTTLFFGAMQLPFIFGTEGAPIINEEQGVNEVLMIYNANRNWMEQNEVIEVPPWLELTMAYGTVVGQRFTMPVTQKKTKNLWGWLRRKRVGSKVANWMKALWPANWKKKGEKQNGAYDDSRYNHEREDNPGQTISK